MAKRKKKPVKEERISLHPLSLEQALKIALGVKLTDVKALEAEEKRQNKPKERSKNGD